MKKESWEIKKLGEICDIFDSLRKPITKKDRKSGIYPYYGASGIQDYVDDYIFDGTYVLVGEDGAKWNSNDKTAFLANGKCWANNHVHVLQINELSTNGWVIYYLNQKDLNEYITGAVIPKLNQSSLRNILIPVPPLAIQEQIVAELDTLSNIVAQKKKQLQELDTLAQATFYELFGDPVENEKGWKVKPIREVSDSIVPGRDKPKSFTGNIPWVNTADLRDLAFVEKSQSNIGLTDTEIKTVRAKIIPPNSVLMTCVGDLGITSINTKEVVINQQLHSYQCHDNVNNLFIMYCLSLRKDYMYKMATSTTLPYMNKTTCNNIPIFLPPLPLQNQFAERIEAIEKQKELINQSITETEKLFSYTMDKYFN